MYWNTNMESLELKLYSLRHHYHYLIYYYYIAVFGFVCNSCKMLYLKKEHLFSRLYLFCVIFIF